MEFQANEQIKQNSQPPLPHLSEKKCLSSVWLPRKRRKTKDTIYRTDFELHTCCLVQQNHLQNSKKIANLGFFLSPFATKTTQTSLTSLTFPQLFFSQKPNNKPTTANRRKKKKKRITSFRSSMR